LILHQSREGFKSLDNADDGYEEAVQNWLRNNGRGFYEGSIEVRKYKGELPRPEQIICSVDDDTHRWVSYLKGPVVGYSKAEHAYFVVYVPWSAYGWVSNIIVGARYLWLGVGTNEGILVYDKKVGALKIMPVPGVSDKGYEYTSPTGAIYPSSVWGGLHVSGSALYEGDKRLTLPGYVKAKTEFEDAASCATD